MAPFRRCAVFGLFIIVSLGRVATAPTDFEEELAFLNSLKADLMANQYDGAITIRDIPKASTRYLIEKYGYPAETHTVTTDDGYRLTVFRIPNPGRPAVFIQHGILASSADWVVLGPKKALALMLHDAGYDVWIGNSRGSTYSRDHVSMSPSERKFWDFSWHEIGIYDLPACIDYVLKKTDQKDLTYVAHSQGTTAFFVMMSQKPEYNEKVRAMFAMAPVAFLHEVKSFPLRVISLATNQISFVAEMLGLYEFLPSTTFTRRLSAYLCSDQSVTQSLCTNILFMICGFNSDQLNKTMLPEILENIPAGSSTKQIVHFGQLIRRDPIFRQFDYGWIRNLMYYGSWNPPSYDLSKVTTQVHLHYGENDLVATPEGVSLLNKLLPNSVEYRRVPHDRWNHMDFLFAKDARDLIYDRILTTVKKIAPV